MKKIKVNLKQVYELSSKGYNLTMIGEAIGISRSAIYSKHRDILDAYKRGKATARKTVIDDLFARSAEDQSATASIFLANRLNVFADPFTTSKPKDLRHARNKIADIYKAYADNEITGEKADRLIKYLEAYVKAYEMTELQDRMQEIEQTIKKRQKGRKSWRI